MIPEAKAPKGFALIQNMLLTELYLAYISFGTLDIANVAIAPQLNGINTPIKNMDTQAETIGVT